MSALEYNCTSCMRPLVTMDEGGRARIVHSEFLIVCPHCGEVCKIAAYGIREAERIFYP